MEVDKQRIAELVCKLQSGDDSDFKELYELTCERAFFVAFEFTKDKQDSEDILQESYVKAISKINELDKPESFSSWLNQIVANKSKDFLKKKKPMLFNSDEEETEATELLPDEDTSFNPEENLDQTELQKAVMEVLDELSEEKRACVMMMYFEELSVGEIAETLEIPEGTVKTRLFSARKDLKDKFSKRGITSAYSIAPIGVVLWTLRRMSDTVSKTFVGSGASAKVLAGITVAGTGAAASAAVAGTTAATTAAAVGTGTATATATGTGIAAKIAALTVAQKVIAGVSVAAVVAGGTVGVVTVVNDDNKKGDISTTAYTEEYTTAPSFETTLAVEALGIVEFSETTELLSNESTSLNSSTLKNSAAKTQSSTVKTTDKSTTSDKYTSTRKQTTTQKSITTTKKQTTTQKSATTNKQTTTSTKATTTKKETTAKVTTTEAETTTKKETTTKVTTTKKPTTTKVTTTKPTTTKRVTTTEPETEEVVRTTKEQTTEAIATVIIVVYDLNDNIVETITDAEVSEGTEINKSYIIGKLNEKGYEPESGFGGDFVSSAVAGETYNFVAYL